jgi:hypothetical protein
MDFGEIGWRVFSGFTWLRIGICGWFSLMRWWTFGFWRHGVRCLQSRTHTKPPKRLMGLWYFLKQSIRPNQVLVYYRK